MRNNFYFVLGLVFVIFFSSCSQHSTPGKLVYKKKDQKRVEAVLAALESEIDKSTAELVVMAGKQFLEIPYVGFTVEKGRKEQLVVNLRGLDCTTFAENCLAISRTVKSNEPTFERFTQELGLIRYRDGIMNGYPSRLHYFSDWIYNNEKSGLVKNVTEDISDILYPLEVNFMSKHPQSYKRIKNDMSLLKVIADQERIITAREMHFIPEEKIKEFEDQLQDGDIVGITTSIDGMDIQHVVILVRINDQIHIMHASSAAQKVLISEGTLKDYLLENKKATGIMVARPLD